MKYCEDRGIQYTTASKAFGVDEVGSVSLTDLATQFKVFCEDKGLNMSVASRKIEALFEFVAKQSIDEQDPSQCNQQTVTTKP